MADCAAQRSASQSAGGSAKATLERAKSRAAENMTVDFI